MEPSSNPPAETLLRIPENQKGPMEKFQNVVLKLAQTLPNAPLAPAARTLLQDRLNRFVSEYRTPDHPPYAAMIERAIRELNEKRGSNEESISQFLEKEYNSLPWAHPTMLKRHLGNLCLSGDIVVTRTKTYKLPSEISIPNPPNTKVKRDPPKRKTRWRWDWEKDKLRRLKKNKLAKSRIQQRGKKAKVVKNYQEQDERGNKLFFENDGNPISRDIANFPTIDLQDGQQSEGTMPKILNPSSSDLACFKEFPNLGLVEIEPMSVDKQSERLLEHDGKEEQLIGEIGQNPVSSGITILAQANVASVQKQEQSEISEPPGCDLSSVMNLRNLGLAEVEPTSAENLFNSERARRQLRRWNQDHPEFKADVSMDSAKLVTSHGSEDSNSLLSGHSNLEMPLKTPDSNTDQKHCENDSMSVKVDEVYSRRKKTMSEKIEPYFKKIGSLSLPLTSSTSEITSNGKRPQELPPQQRKVPELRRSLRLSLAKPKHTKVVDYMVALPTQLCNPSEEKPAKLTEVVDYVIALPSPHCSPSEKMPSADCLEKPTGQHDGSPAKRHCPGPNTKDVMMSSDDRLGGQTPEQGSGTPPKVNT